MPIAYFKTILYLIALSLVSLSALAQELEGQVVRVADGDTLTILDNKKQQIKIRLAEIDTPEAAQPYGTKAKQELSRLIYGKTIVVKVQDKDRYGRWIGRVYAGNLDVNAEMVRLGAAWVYRKYASDQTLHALETLAKQKKAGVWSLPEAEQTPPWEWRKARK